MNSIIDLNTAANVTFASQGSYSLNLGNVTGNGTVTVDRYEQFAIPEQANLVSVSNAVRDILIDVTANSVGVINSVNYIGPYANIGVLQITPFSWRVFGIRDVNRWDEAFANVRVSGNSPANYSFVTTVNDQAGNTRNWGTAVTVLDPPVFTVVGPVIYSEETRTVIGNSVLSITGNVLGVTTWTMYANVANTSVGQLAKSSNVNNTQSSISLTGNVTSLNSQIGANTIRFIPGSDLVSNVANAVSFSLVTGNVTRASAAANLQIANTVTELVVTSPLTYNEDQAVNLGNITITDSDEFASSYELILSQITANTANTTGRFLMRGADQGNVLSITVPAAPVAGSFANQPIVLNPANPNQVTAVGNVTTGVANGVMWSNTVTPGVLQINNTVGSDDHWLLATGGNIQFANTDTFTLESWAVATTSDTNRPILSLGQTTTANSLSIGISTTTGRAGVFAGNTTIMQSAANSVPLGVWKHIVVTHAPSAGNSVLNLYVQGVLANTYVGNIGSNIGNGQVYIGGSPGLVSLTGYMDEVRISNVARYPSSVTVPTTRFGYDANNMLLLHGNSNIGSNVIYNDAPGLFDITYQPGPDIASNLVLQAQLVKTTEFGNTFTTTANIAVNIGNTHNDYSVTTNYNYYEDSTQPLVFNITDTDAFANTYTVTFAQTTGNAGTFYLNTVSQGANTSVSITANRATVNAANIAWVPATNSIGNVTMTYNQSKITIFGQTSQQASNVAIALAGLRVVNYVAPASLTYLEDVELEFGNVQLTDDQTTHTYRANLTLDSSNPGTLVFESQGIAANSITANGVWSNLNGILGNIAYTPTADYASTGNITIRIDDLTSQPGVFTTKVINLIPTPHDEFSNPTTLVYQASGNAVIGTTPLGNFRITDVALNKNYTSNITLANAAVGNLYIGATNYGNAVSLSGNIAQVNANLTNVVMVVSGANSNTTVNYTQQQTTDSILQGNISINLMYAPTLIHEYSGVEKAAGQLADVTAGTADFYVSAYSLNSGNTLYEFRSNTAVANLRSTTITRTTNTAVSLTGNLGFAARADSGASSVCSLDMWIYPTKELPECAIARFVGGLDHKLETFGNTLYFFRPVTSGVVNKTNFGSPVGNVDIWGQRIVMGNLTANTWHHIAIQQDAGNVVSAWYNGQPVTEFYSAGNAAAGNGVPVSSTNFFEGTEELFAEPIFGAPNNPTNTTIARPTIPAFGTQGREQASFVIDNLVISNAAPRTAGVAFTPSLIPPTYSGNARIIINGI